MIGFIQKNKKIVAVAVMITLLLSACSTPPTVPKEEELMRANLPSTVYYDDETGEPQEMLQLGGQESASISAPDSFYVDAVMEAVIVDLMDELGCSRESGEMLILQGGLQIFTCMDQKIQTLVDAVYEERSNLDYPSESGESMQSAIVLLDNETGQVLALSGAVGENADRATPNRATQMLRQPGSAFMPLSVYAPALEQGDITPDSMENDQADEYGFPRNPYGSYKGSISIKEALCISSHCVAVEVMNKYLSPETSAQFVKDVFQVDLVIDRTVGDATYTDVALPALALGGLTDGVSPMTMAAAYSVFPRKGVYLEPALYTKVLDSEGNELLSRDTEGKNVLKESTAYDMTEMLQETVSRGTGVEAKFTGQDIAGTPGITTAKRDLWFIGYTPYYTAAVWSGYDTYDQMTDSDNPATVLWKQVMEAAHKELPYKRFAK